MTTTHVLEGDLGALLGPEIRSIYATVRTNLPEGTALVDLDNDVVRMRGPERIPLDDKRRFAIELIATNSTGTNVPAGTLRYTVDVRWVGPGLDVEHTFKVENFQLTTDLDLADAIETADPPASVANQYLTQMQAMLDAAEEITGLTGEDAAVALLVGDDDSDTRAALELLIANAALPWFTPKQYGAVGNGVADDTTAVQNAANAAMAAGGSLYLGGKSNTCYRITGRVNIHSKVSVFGDGLFPQIAGGTVSTFKLDSATAQIRLAGRTSPADTTSRGGAWRDFTIDGNGKGDPTGALFIDFGASRDFSNIAITGAAGVGLILDTTQNSTFSAIEVTGCGGTGIVLDNGCGGNQFLRCEVASNSGYQIETRDSRAGAHGGYPYGPGRNHFTHCLFEDYNTGGQGIAIAKFTHGQTTRFVSCAFSASAQNQTSGRLIDITTGGLVQTEVVLADGCTLYGFSTTNGIYVGANARVVVEGALGAGSVPFVFTTDGVSYGRIDGRIDYLSPTELYQATGAGTFSQWGGLRNFGLDIVVDTTAGHKLPLRIFRENETQPRWSVNDDGLMHFNNGVSGASLATLGWDNTNSHNLHLGGLVQQGRRGHVRTLNAAASGAVTIDAKSTSVHTLITSGNVTSMTVNNLVNGAEITIQITKGNAAHTIVWPTNVRWIQNRLPLVSATNYTFITLRYDSGDSTLKEIGRAEETGTATRIGPGINPPRFIACTTATAASTAAKTTTITEPTSYDVGDVFVLTLTNGNTVGSPTLSVNGGAAIAIRLGGVAASAAVATLAAGGTWFLRWNGTAFEMFGPSADHGVLSGNGSPEGVVTAGVSTLYRRLDGGAGTCLYVKETGTGNTGWVAK